jgi:ABC-2 type transport system permease protein
MLLPLAVTVALTGVAYLMLEHRDVGAGMLPVRQGPGTGAPGLLNPVGLAWRLQRNVLYGWAVAMGLTGIAYGAMAPEVEDLVGSSESTREILEHFGGTGDLVDVYLAATIAMGGLAVAAYTVQALLRLRHEETTGTLDAVIAAGVSRTKVLASHVVVVVAGTITLLVLYGATMGLAYGLTGTGAVEQLVRYTWAGLLQAPAAMALGGFAVAVFGLVPGASRALAWAAYVVCLVLGQLGDLFGLPEAVLGISPFSHLPAVPVETAALAPVLVLSASAGALAALGAIALRRRDLGVT